MRLFGGIMAGVGVASLIIATPAEAAAQASPLSVMTYNVHGLPWPLAQGRDADFGRIAARLRAMRRNGTQPDVVVLQEAFTDAAKAIGRESGYPYIVTGPSTDEVDAATPSALERVFVAGASWFKGERSGKLVDSGLVILSDHPIVGVRRTAFPSYACAGFDCLANKGVLLAKVEMPGAASPVVIATAHFNSRHSSGVPDSRSNHAYRLQLEAAGRFLARMPWHSDPIIFAGDFNVGKSGPRRQWLANAMSGWWKDTRLGPMRDAMHMCHGDFARFPKAAEESFARAKDWQIFASTRLAGLNAERISVPFGRARNGAMLSDHFGYTAHYRLTPGSPASVAPARLASAISL